MDLMTLLLENQQKNPLNTLNQAVYEVLLNAITDMYFQPGQRLNINQLAKTFNVSRTTIEYAIKRLDKDQLIETAKGRTPKVIGMPLNDVKNLFIARAGIECRACGQAAENMSEEDFRELEKILQKFRVAQNNLDYKMMMNTDSEFHMFIINKSQNKFLISSYEPLLPYLRLFRAMYSVFVTTDFCGMHEEHRVIYNAMKFSPPVQAGSAMRRHLQAILSSTEEQHKKSIKRSAEVITSLEI